MPTSPGGAVPRDMREWDRYFRGNGFQADNAVHTFTPTWAGFSADPVGDINYMDFGALVTMWVDADLLGTSDEDLMQFSGIPQALRPDDVVTVGILIPSYFINSGSHVAGAIAIDPTGTATAFINVPTTIGGVDQTAPSAFSFRTTGSKGLPSGWLVTYRK